MKNTHSSRARRVAAMEGGRRRTGCSPFYDARCRRRVGFTLYEVVLALTILLVSLAILAELIGTGSRAATRTELHSRATLLCESKLAEVAAGVEPCQPAQDVPFDATAPDWVWSVGVLPGPHPDLLLVAVTATYAAPNRSAEASETLVRYMRRPNLFQEQKTLIETADAEAAAAAEANASTSAAGGSTP